LRLSLLIKDYVKLVTYLFSQRPLQSKLGRGLLH